MQLPESILLFKPSILKALRSYTRERFVKDVTAGITVGIVALPLAMAFAIAGLIASGETVIRNSECVQISFPGFFELLDQLRQD